MRLKRRRKAIALGHFLSATWCAFFGLSLLHTALNYPTIPTGGVWTYTALFSTHMLLANAHHSSKRA